MGEKIRLKLAKIYDDGLLFMDGFDDCIMGVVERCGMEPVVVYSRNKVIAKLEKQGMDSEEALDFHYNDQASSYYGERTPVFFDNLSDIVERLG
jgi:hypothetical protein